MSSSLFSRYLFLSRKQAKAHVCFVAVVCTGYVNILVQEYLSFTGMFTVGAPKHCLLVFCYVRNVFFMGVIDPRDSMQVCVRHCPTSDIETWQHARDFATHNKSKLCRYDIGPENYGEQQWNEDGPCPNLPVFKR